MPVRQNLITAALLFGLVALTFLLNQSALSGNWRFDDGWLLDYASRFSPFDYFFNPAITRGYSLNNLTPTNPLIFDLNLWLFGFDPKGFYIQHLTTLAACAIASYFLLRCWVSPLFAFLGGVLFLIGAPTQFVAQQLMVGHYVSGLLFSILAIYAFQLNLNRRHWLLTPLTTLFYVIATTCKEVYFPLPFVLLLLPGQSLSVRLKLALPMLIWSAAYMFWRLAVLGSFVGGYDAGGQAFSLSKAVQSYGAIPELLFATPYLPWLLSLIFIALIVTLALRKRLNIPLMVVALLAVLLPLLPLTQHPGITEANRYLLLPWWLFTMTLIIALANTDSLNIGLKSVILLIFTASAGTQAWQAQQAMQPRVSHFDAVYQFFLQPPAGGIFYSKQIKDAYHLDTVLNGARYAQARVSEKSTEKLPLFMDSRNLRSIDTEQKSIWRYDTDCQCIINISERIKSGKKPKPKAPKILTVAILPPYPPLFEAGPGSLSMSMQNEQRLQFQGHSVHPADDLEHEIILITPRQPKRIKSKLAPVKAESAGEYRFTLTLDYADRDSRDLAAKQSCLLIRSAYSPIRLLPNQQASVCNDLLSLKP
ncbi:MAG: hypothetical protein JAZ20_12195 [Candidatus Thiodiazotropha weberae]|nr:hypothetical protein [Candidatus Thiodiazotropha lotti]MCG8021167.1 hypothetical protein [Candidatus Thiodiazotropha lotti]MCW4208335.1 hypothetical protein [Candidatus Thiodiazotropha lotti]MCW4215097.1 hypothetical protein [Candidatus Thiodiazotropha lotti]